MGQPPPCPPTSVVLGGCFGWLGEGDGVDRPGSCIPKQSMPEPHGHTPITCFCLPSILSNLNLPVDPCAVSTACATASRTSVSCRSLPVGARARVDDHVSGMSANPIHTHTRTPQHSTHSPSATRVQNAALFTILSAHTASRPRPPPLPPSPSPSTSSYRRRRALRTTANRPRPSSEARSKAVPDSERGSLVGLGEEGGCVGAGALMGRYSKLWWGLGLGVRRDYDSASGA